MGMMGPSAGIHQENFRLKCFVKSTHCNGAILVKDDYNCL